MGEALLLNIFFTFGRETLPRFDAATMDSTVQVQLLQRKWKGEMNGEPLAARPALHLARKAGETSIS